MSSPFRVVAIIAAYNEGDIISQVIGHLSENGVETYLIDHHSTDDTVERARTWAGKGLIGIETFPEDAGLPKELSNVFTWEEILRRKERLAMELGADWYIHHDADEIRESPFPGTTLAEGLRRVDSVGYNCVDFELYNFWPTDEAWQPGISDPRSHFQYFEGSAAYDSLQRKCWRATAEPIALTPSGGHDAEFASRRVFPIRFLLRHYRIRSTDHGRRKIHAERLARFDPAERARGWHIQYDEIGAHDSVLLRDPNRLKRFDLDAERQRLLEANDETGAPRDREAPGAPDVADLPSYNERVASQIAQYAETVDIHTLPAAFHVWSHNYLRPGMEHVFGSSDVTTFYADAYLAARPAARGRILSIGCGDATIEVNLAENLRSRGLDFEVMAADSSPIMLEKTREKIAAANLTQYVKAIEADLNNISIDGPFDLIMATHSLHHILGLEQLFDFAKEALSDHGIFATQGMIGRNGHQRWPETRAVVEAFWPTLSERQRYHYKLKRLDLDFHDHDCSTEGFEGIRAQDILRLILERFHPMRFFASGGFIDLVLDRAYGHGWDTSSEHDVATIHWLSKLNDILLDAGAIKPTLMMAWFGKHPTEEVYFRNRSARASVRTETPAWAASRMVSRP